VKLVIQFGGDGTVLMGQSGYSKSKILLIWPNLDLFLSMTVQFAIVKYNNIVNNIMY
jgi:hypothetical protein